MANQNTSKTLKQTSSTMSHQEKTELQELRAFVSKHTDLEVMQHFSNKPLPEAPRILNDAVAVFPDLEWFDNRQMLKAPQKITEVGYTVLPLIALQHCKSPEDFPALIKKAAVYHIRVLENCHIRNKAEAFKDAEKNSLFCPTRFVAEAEAKRIFANTLNTQTMKNGRRAPVIVVGQGWNHDVTMLKNEWQFNINKLDGVVHTIKSLGTLAQQAGIIPKPDKSLGQKLPKFDELLAGFGVQIEGLWRHNGANDAVYQMTVALLVSFYSILYPGPNTGYGIDATLAGSTIKGIWNGYAEANKQLPPPTWGYAQFCHYCETPEEHDAAECPLRSTDAVHCKLCANAIGKKNKKYRDRASDHQTGRCLLQYNHHTRSFPPWFLNLNPSFEDQRDLSRASAVKDFETIGRIMYQHFFLPGCIGREEIEDHEKRMKAEDNMYSEDEDEGQEVDEDGFNEK